MTDRPPFTEQQLNNIESLCDALESFPRLNDYYRLPFPEFAAVLRKYVAQIRSGYHQQEEQQ